jgi:hypothetical protein
MPLLSLREAANEKDWIYSRSNCKNSRITIGLALGEITKQRVSSLCDINFHHLTKYAADITILWSRSEVQKAWHH